MDIIKSVYDISEQFLNLPVPVRQHVQLNHNNINELVRKMIIDGKANFYSTEDQEVEEKKNELFIVLRELVASSINYCYWYGNADVRPMGANSGGMYDLVDEAMDHALLKAEASLDVKSEAYYQGIFYNSIKYLIQLLSLHRYPLLEERKRHLLEVADHGIRFANYVVLNKEKHGKELIEDLIRNFTGFSSDTFLKRTSLFFIQLNRQLGWFPELMQDIFVPADYQVPKMLRHFKALEYSNHLSYKIQEGKLIEKGSLMECQIRAATIKVCRMIMDITGWNISEVDTWLWTKRKLPIEKFHLTITSDY